MDLIFLLIIISVIAVIAFILKGRRGISESEVWPFYSRRLLSQPEQILYHRLVKSLPGYFVFPQVQLSRILNIKRGYNWRAWNNRINRLSLDFIVCGPDSSVVAAIELDDSGHKNILQKERDTRKDKALYAAHITVIRWQAKTLPDESIIKTSLSKITALHVVHTSGKESAGHCLKNRVVASPEASPEKTFFSRS